MALRYCLPALLFIPLQWVFAPLTFWASSLALSFLRVPNIVNGAFIHLEGVSLELVFECMVFPAYFLLAALACMTPMAWKTRAQLWLSGACMIFSANIARIAFVGVLLSEGDWLAFEEFHLFAWRFLSWLFVAVVWILLVSVFKVKGVPLLDDFRALKKV